MAEPFIAEIRIFPFSFAPRGWAWCDGQLIPLQQNAALFSLLGTTYGGDGKTTFALPNLQERAPMHPGQGPGLSNHDLGEAGGSETVTLTESEMPAHGHTLRAATQDNADVNTITSTTSFAGSTGGALYQAAANVTLSNQALAPAGNGTPHNNMQPYLTVSFCIALEGIYPARG